MNTDRTFDWKSRHDERSRNYGVAPLVTGARRRRNWRAPSERLDQGAEGACVGFAWAIELLSSPVSAKLPRPRDSFARMLYREAQKIDEWPGEDYEGTSVLAGAKMAQRLGYIESYRWAFGIEQVIDALVELGPVIIGVPWFSNMYQTEPNGLVDVGGRLVGGHAICLTGYHPKHPVHRGPVIRWRNSWGPHYGINGNGMIRPNDLSWLLSQYGEACVPMGRTR
jgi:hypothetical protein